MRVRGEQHRGRRGERRQGDRRLPGRDGPRRCGLPLRARSRAAVRAPRGHPPERRDRRSRSPPTPRASPTRSSRPATNLFAYRIVGGADAPVGAPDAVDTNANDGDFLTRAVDRRRCGGQRRRGLGAGPRAQDRPCPPDHGHHPRGRRRAGVGRLRSGVSPPSGGAAEVGVDSDDAGRAWVTFRQEFAYGGGNDSARAVARRLVGGAFEAPLRFDNNPPVPATGRDVELPSLAVTPSGGLALGDGALEHRRHRGALPGLRRHRRARLGQSRSLFIATPSSEETFASVAVVPRGAGLFADRDPADAASTGMLQARGSGSRAAASTRPRSRCPTPRSGRVLLDHRARRGRRRGLGLRRLSPGRGSGRAVLVRILVAQVDLPRLPGPRPSPTGPPRASPASASRAGASARAPSCRGARP